jgi:hypothetical protein
MKSVFVVSLAFLALVAVVCAAPSDVKNIDQEDKIIAMEGEYQHCMLTYFIFVLLLFLKT